MTIKKPDNQSSAKLQSVLNANNDIVASHKNEGVKPLGIELLKYGSTVYLKPNLTIDKDLAYVIWINGKIHTLPCLSVLQGYWNINLNSALVRWDATQKIGYRVDGSGASTTDNVLIWAFADDDNTEILGFSATKVPSSTFSAVSNGNLGSLATFTITNARAFNVEATVRVSNGNWENNYGVITEITNNTTLVVKMYPSISILANNNITGTTATTQIRQMDNYFPWNGRTDTSDFEDRLFMINYRLVGEVNQSQPFIQPTEIPVGSILAWHKDIISPALTLPDGWLECNGQACNDPQSIFYGTNLPNLNTAPAGYNGAYFLRGGSTSGTLQSATVVFDRNTGSRIVLTSEENGTRVYNSDGTFTQTVNLNYIASSLTSDGSVNQYEATRPLNMSVVWIIKTR